MKLLANNPNLGVHYRGLIGTGITRSGAYFGQDAADFLFGIQIATAAGWIVPQREATISIGVTSSSYMIGGTDPQNQVARVQNCATPNSILEFYSKEFEAQWERTRTSGQENGSLIFYEEATNQYHRIALSEGTHVEGVPALPEGRGETRKAISDFRAADRHVYFLAFFHTHPDFPDGQSRNNTPSGGDGQYQLDFRNPLGIIRSSKGYAFYSDGRSFDSKHVNANNCIWRLNQKK